MFQFQFRFPKYFYPSYYWGGSSTSAAADVTTRRLGPTSEFLKTFIDRVETRDDILIIDPTMPYFKVDQWRKAMCVTMGTIDWDFLFFDARGEGHFQRKDMVNHILDQVVDVIIVTCYGGVREYDQCILHWKRDAVASSSSSSLHHHRRPEMERRLDRLVSLTRELVEHVYATWIMEQLSTVMSNNHHHHPRLLL